MSYDRYNKFLNDVCAVLVSCLFYPQIFTFRLDNQTELLESEREENEPLAAIALAGHNKYTIGFSDCSFSWDSFDQPEGPSKRTRKAFRLRFDGEVLFQGGKINIIVGPTASGKVGDNFIYSDHCKYG